MKEQRLIDANAIKQKVKNSTAIRSVKAGMLVFVDCAPAIDPETLPIVQELRKELERVTRERNAAIKDLKECAVENYMECNYCKNEIKKYVSEICRNCNDGSNFEHRGEGNRSQTGDRTNPTCGLKKGGDYARDCNHFREATKMVNYIE